MQPAIDLSSLRNSLAQMDEALLLWRDQPADSVLKPHLRAQAKDIVQLRSQLQISQGVLAAFVNTTTSSVAQWEAGDKRPGGPARRVLGLLKRKGLEAFA